MGADHPDASFTFQFEDSHSDVHTMLNNVAGLPCPLWEVSLSR